MALDASEDFPVIMKWLFFYFIRMTLSCGGSPRRKPYHELGPANKVYDTAMDAERAIQPLANCIRLRREG